jgi:hypothetical protein
MISTRLDSCGLCPFYVVGELRVGECFSFGGFDKSELNVLGIFFDLLSINDRLMMGNINPGDTAKSIRHATHPLKMIIKIPRFPVEKRFWMIQVVEPPSPFFLFHI